MAMSKHTVLADRKQTNRLCSIQKMAMISLQRILLLIYTVFAFVFMTDVQIVKEKLSSWLALANLQAYMAKLPITHHSCLAKFSPSKRTCKQA